MRHKSRTVLPGFGLTLGITCTYLSLIVVLIPLATVFSQDGGAHRPDQFWATVTDPRVVASYRLTFGASFVAALVNAVFGLLVAWVLVRYRFPGRRLVDALVDLPFALPTAVAGIALTALYAPNGWVGQLPRAARHQGGVHLARHHGRADLHRPAVRGPHGAAGARRSRDRGRGGGGQPRAPSAGRPSAGSSFPTVAPALLTGFALAFARAIGEYGSVVFISGNMPMKTEIVPLLIITKLEQYDYAGATAVALVMLVVSFVLLLAINLLQWAARRRTAV